MPTLTIDGRAITVEPGTTVLQAARELGIAIPTLCHLEGYAPLTTCFVCVVRINGGGRLLPSCATAAAEGMVVESDAPAVATARKAALELLLSDHAGDCRAPCQRTCPAHMDIPAMLTAIAEDRLEQAVAVVKERIPLPAVLGRICPELCEHTCRRGLHDAAVSICALKGWVGDYDLAQPEAYQPPCEPSTGRHVAVVGAGPAGLSAAYYLRRQGHAVTLYDAAERAGGALWQIPPERLPPAVLAAEVAALLAVGITFRGGQRLGAGLSLDGLQAEHDAVLLALGEISPATAQGLGLEAAARGLKVDRGTLATSLPGVFAAGSAVVPSQLAIRAIGAGRHAADAMHAYLTTGTAAADERVFDFRLGQLNDADLLGLLQTTARPDAPRSDQPLLTAPAAQAAAEALRCLHCECAGAAGCLLKQYAQQYGAGHDRWRGERRPVERVETHPLVLFEPGKCILCGRCVAIAEAAREPLGLTYVGRGFAVRVAVPLAGELAEGLGAVAEECARACPTGALVLRPHRKDRP